MLSVVPILGGSVNSFTLLLAVAMVAVAWAGSRQACAAGLDARLAWDLFPWAALAGLAGAKLYYVLLHFGELRTDLSPLLRGGMVWYGGVIGALLGGWWRIRAWRVPGRLFLDGAAAPAMLGYAIGRVGCFLVGDDYGAPSSVPWAVAFPAGAPPTTAANLRAFGADVAAAIPADAVLRVHPTQLYEALAGLLLFLLLWRLFRSPLRGTGAVFAVLLVLYGLERFLIEFLRLKDDRLSVGLTVAQLISAALIAAGLVLWHRTRSGATGAPVPGRTSPVLQQ